MKRPYLLDMKKRSGNCFQKYAYNAESNVKCQRAGTQRLKLITGNGVCMNETLQAIK